MICGGGRFLALGAMGFGRLALGLGGAVGAANSLPLCAYFLLPN